MKENRPGPAAAVEEIEFVRPWMEEEQRQRQRQRQRQPFEEIVVDRPDARRHARAPGSHRAVEGKLATTIAGAAVRRKGPAQKKGVRRSSSHALGAGHS